jgi:hypothetical protein
MELEQALKQLPIEKKARRLRVLWPLIEAKLAEGVSHAAVLDFLNRNGFELTESTYKSYLRRFRKMQRAPISTQPLPSRTSTPAPSSGSTNRPATFDYDPRGIPDLLK